jgi:hypothetical protein
MLNVKIRDFNIIDGDSVQVTATVGHARNNKPNPQDVMIALHNETGGCLSAVAGSFVSLDSAPVRQVVSGVMSLSKAVLPFTDAQQLENQGFRSLSKAGNMFMDAEENIWNVEETGDGKVAVRSTTIDNPEELQGLLSKCSARVSAGQDPSYFTATASSNTQTGAIPAGSFLTYVHEGKTKFGVCVSSVYQTEEESSYTGNLIVLASGEEQSATISDTSVVQVAGQVDYEEPEMDSVSAGNVGKSQIQGLVDYYRKVFGHRPDFFAELEKRIRGHAYA